jgi:excisionase family DNA binding protein
LTVHDDDGILTGIDNSRQNDTTLHRKAGFAMDEKLYDTQEAMTFLGISRSTLYHLMESGQLTGRRVGGQVRFYDSDLRAAVLTREVPSAASQSPIARGQLPGMKYG